MWTQLCSYFQPVIKVAFNKSFIFLSFIKTKLIYSGNLITKIDELLNTVHMAI